MKTRMIPKTIPIDYDLANRPDPILDAAHEKFVQEGIARWHKKRAEEKEMANDGQQTVAEEKTKTEPQS